MGLLKTLFGKRNEPKKVRVLNSPRDLAVGDIVKFSFLSQDDLSNKEFEVSRLNSYVYDGVTYPELILKDRSNNIIFLMIEDEDGEEYLALSRKISKGRFAEIITPDELDAVLRKGVGGKVIIDKPKPSDLEAWLADSYTVADSEVKGAFARGDARKSSPDEKPAGEGFTSYTMLDASEEYALELEVYDTNEIELSVTVYHDFAAITEMWPAAAEE